MATPSTTLKLGTRGSLLARVQSQAVADALEKQHAALAIELVILKTTGDQIADRPLHEAGGKGLFTRELEQALLDSAIDFAVHSFKDVPVTTPLVPRAADELTIAATTHREDPRDVLILATPPADPPTDPLSLLPNGARVGTGSLRRRCQLLALRPDLRVESIRGNIDTRLRKVTEGEFDAVILAYAGLKRAGLFDSARAFPIDPDQMLPAAGQGALALQCRRDDSRTVSLLSEMNHPPTAACVAAEREVVRLLEGDCTSPIAALATIDDTAHILRLRVAVGRRGGDPPLLRATASAPSDQPHSAAAQAFRSLSDQGAARHLRD
jgi:hydroxymethylbilane synthase